MAKGLRSSVRKRSRAKLRTTVFGPAMDARTERLSLKLQELASKRLCRDGKRTGIEGNISGIRVMSSCLIHQACKSENLPNDSGNRNEVQIRYTKSVNGMLV